MALTPSIAPVSDAHIDEVIGVQVATPGSDTRDAIDALGYGTGAVTSVNGNVGVVVIDKTDVGLANVDNTSNATERAASATLTNKTISGSSNTLSNIAQSSVTNLTSDLAGKVATTRQVNGHALSADVTVTKSDVGLSAVTNDAQIPLAYLDTATTLANNSDTKVPSQKAIKTYADNLQGRTRPALRDDFSRYSNGALSGQVPIIGSAWVTSGAQATTVSTGRATSTGTGYAVQTFTDTPTSMECFVSFSGSNPITSPMTMAFCRNTVGSGTMLDHLVHLNFGPTGFSLTVRKDGGAFDGVLSGNWWAVVPMDGTVVRVVLAVDGDSAVVFGPHGEVFATVGRRISDVLAGGGKTIFWEPNTSGTEQAFVHTARADTTATTGYTSSVVQPQDLAGLARMIGHDGRAFGNHYDSYETWIGRSPANNMPAFGFGANEIHAILAANTSIGATTFNTDQKIPPGSTLVIGYGTTGETLTQNSSVASGSGPPYTSTTTGAATKAHSAGDPVTATPPASMRKEVYFNTGNGNIYLWDASLIIQGASGVYFGAGQDVQLYRDGANVLRVGYGDTLAIEGAWNAGPLRMGNNWLWVDATGDLRIKGSAPSSDTDGVVVGTQS